RSSDLRAPHAGFAIDSSLPFRKVMLTLCQVCLTKHEVAAMSTRPYKPIVIPASTPASLTRSAPWAKATRLLLQLRRHFGGAEAALFPGFDPDASRILERAGLRHPPALRSG